MSATPWFKFYAGDFLNDPDVDALPLEAQGILIRMWSVTWIEGSIPGDVKELARKCKVRSATMQKYIQPLMQFFLETENGRYISSRMELERRRCGIVSKARRSAANTRWNKERRAIASAKHTANAGANDSGVRSQNADCKTLPPTPLPEGGDVLWRDIERILKDELSTCYVLSHNFSECDYDKCFREAYVVKSLGRTIYLGHPNPTVLREGLSRYRRRINAIAAGLGYSDLRVEVSCQQGNSLADPSSHEDARASATR